MSPPRSGVESNETKQSWTQQQKAQGKFVYAKQSNTITTKISFLHNPPCFNSNKRFEVNIINNNEEEEESWHKKVLLLLFRILLLLLQWMNKKIFLNSKKMNLIIIKKKLMAIRISEYSIKVFFCFSLFLEFWLKYYFIRVKFSL